MRNCTVRFQLIFEILRFDFWDRGCWHIDLSVSAVYLGLSYMTFYLRNFIWKSWNVLYSISCLYYLRFDFWGRGYWYIDLSMSTVHIWLSCLDMWIQKFILKFWNVLYSLNCLWYLRFDIWGRGYWYIDMSLSTVLYNVYYIASVLCDIWEMSFEVEDIDTEVWV